LVVVRDSDAWSNRAESAVKGEQNGEVKWEIMHAMHYHQ
jgi:hypothetical protein